MSFMSDMRNHKANIKDKQEKLSGTSPGKEVKKIGEIGMEHIGAADKVACVIIPFIDERGAQEFMKAYDIDNLYHVVTHQMNGKKLKEMIEQCQN